MQSPLPIPYLQTRTTSEDQAREPNRRTRESIHESAELASAGDDELNAQATETQRVSR